MPGTNLPQCIFLAERKKDLKKKKPLPSYRRFATFASLRSSLCSLPKRKNFWLRREKPPDVTGEARHARAAQSRWASRPLPRSWVSRCGPHRRLSLRREVAPTASDGARARPQPGAAPPSWPRRAQSAHHRPGRAVRQRARLPRCPPNSRGGVRGSAAPPGGCHVAETRWSSASRAALPLPTNL